MSATLTGIPLGWLAVIAGISLAAGILAWRRGRPPIDQDPVRWDGWRQEDARRWREHPTARDRRGLHEWKEGDR